MSLQVVVTRPIKVARPSALADREPASARARHEMGLGVYGIAAADSALPAIGGVGMRECPTNNHPGDTATQKEGLRKRPIVEESARRPARHHAAAGDLLKILARACGHSRLSEFELADLCTYKHALAPLTGIPYAGARRWFER